jgi:hypothetical protein
MLNNESDDIVVGNDYFEYILKKAGKYQYLKTLYSIF